MQVLWNGQEAFKAALDLVAAAEHASQQDTAQQGLEPQQFVWRQDMLRPASNAKQVLSVLTSVNSKNTCHKLLVNQCICADCRPVCCGQCCQVSHLLRLQDSVNCRLIATACQLK